jgi:type IV pilus assembly protein PilV
MRNLTLDRQRGMTLIEVLVSVLILAIGLLGAAAIQLNALRYTDSATLSSQASFIAYDMMDRIRANVDGNAAGNGSTDVLALYELRNASSAPAGNLADARVQDLADFRANVEGLPGGTGSINVEPNRFVTVTVGWDDTRAAAASALASGATPQASNPQRIEITSRIGVTP